MSESLSAEAIREVERLVKNGARTEFATHPSEPKHTYWAVEPNGKIDRIEAMPPPLDVRLATPAALVAFAKAHLSTEIETHEAELYYDDAAIVLLLDADRRNRATCTLVRSAPFTWLETRSAAILKQADFVRLLRIDLRGCLPDHSNLLPLARYLKWIGASEADASLQHGRESMGRSITAKVQGVDAIPEEVTLSVPVWENHLYRARVTCAVEILPHEQAFRLTPYPLQLREALDGAVLHLAEVLAEQPVAAFHGKP